MSWPLVLGIVALILAGIEEIRSEGKSPLGYAVVAVAIAIILDAGGLHL